MKPISSPRYLIARSAVCGLLLLCAMGCGKARGPQRVAIKGAVHFNNEPLPSGRILFCPIDDAKGPTAVATVKNGVYAFDRKNGPVVGKNKIQIESIPDPGFDLDDEASYAKAIRDNKGKAVLPAETIPPEYNQRSNLVAMITTESRADLDFSLEKAKPKNGR
jgi:hypothetical protein